ncbi:cytochrome P450 [Actinomycetospora chiangmaiensis]|uniref:cytochrome P450 n=1 Tax=Actinomycetospora chiangmaiensis TaxID=402650 RepID=UPI00035F637E|nr:cytochrome P450 [Actinomycetospora chiangmaiensis]
MSTITLDRYADVRDAFRRHELAQALYDAGGVVMADCLLVLHGAEHRVRRRVENRLFRRGTFRHWEREFLRDVVVDTLRPFTTTGRADLIELGYRTIMTLTAMVAGVDRPTGSDAETDALYRLAKKFSEGATLVHTTRDPGEVRAEVAAALDEFDRVFLQPSIARRTDLLTRLAAGEIEESALPRDVLTALLRHRDELGISDDAIRRECAFYLQAGSHSTADAFSHAADDWFAWSAREPDAATRSTRDPALLQACVYETLRLHPASPVAQRRAEAPIALRNGTEVPEGAVVVLDIAAANRDATVFDRPEEYDPTRVVPAEVPRWGHAFGGGMHACIGTELAGGVPVSAAENGSQVLGTVTLMLEALLAAGARPDPEHPARRDPHSARDHFASYPVLLGP